MVKVEGCLYFFLCTHDEQQYLMASLYTLHFCPAYFSRATAFWGHHHCHGFPPTQWFPKGCLWQNPDWIRMQRHPSSVQGEERSQQIICMILYKRNRSFALVKGNTRSLISLCVFQAAGGTGDGYRGRRSPHTPHERFEGLTVTKALQVKWAKFLVPQDFFSHSPVSQTLDINIHYKVNITDRYDTHTSSSSFS